MDPAWCTYNRVPRLSALRRCSREQCVLKPWLWDFQWLRAGGAADWGICELNGENWAASELFLLPLFMVHWKRACCIKPVAALLMSGYRDNTASLYLHFPCDCVAHVSCFALLSSCRSSVLNPELNPWILRLFAKVAKWARGAGLHGRTEEMKQNSKKKWLCYSASFSKGKRVYVNPWKRLHIVLIQEST